jgi:hypothetical protein
VEDGMARHGHRAQRDLFIATQLPSRFPPEVRQALLVLLEALLRRVTSNETAGREAGDEQDHA